MNVLLWGVLPYVMMAVLIGGLIWRYRYDQFGWTTRSSQLYESRLLRIGSPLFHFGILVVIVGHIGGLVIPKSWTEAVGVSEGMYHFNALLVGDPRRRLHPGRDLDLDLPPAHHRPGVHGDDEKRQGHVRRPGGSDRAGLATTVSASVGGHEDGQLPGDRLPLVPLAVLLPARSRLDGGGSARLPGPHAHRDAAVRHLAIHAVGARLHRAAALPVPPLHRLPEPGYCPRRDPPRRTGLGPGRHA